MRFKESEMKYHVGAKVFAMICRKIMFCPIYVKESDGHFKFIASRPGIIKKSHV